VAEVQGRRATQDVVVTGSGSVVDTLVARDLVDQYRLLVFPTVLGKGRRLFDATNARPSTSGSPSPRTSAAACCARSTIATRGEPPCATRC
jgi:dihydrofolate reductase